MTSLNTLELNDNDISVIPDWIFTHVSLKRISLKRNRLTKFENDALSLIQLNKSITIEACENKETLFIPFPVFELLINGQDKVIIHLKQTYSRISR